MQQKRDQGAQSRGTPSRVSSRGHKPCFKSHQELGWCRRPGQSCRRLRALAPQLSRTRPVRLTATRGDRAALPTALPAPPPAPGAVGAVHSLCPASEAAECSGRRSRGSEDHPPQQLRSAPPAPRAGEPQGSLSAHPALEQLALCAPAGPRLLPCSTEQPPPPPCPTPHTAGWHLPDTASLWDARRGAATVLRAGPREDLRGSPSAQPDCHTAASEKSSVSLC